MNSSKRLILVGVLAVLSFDFVASLAARHLGFDYGNAAIGSAVIYGAIGYVAFRLGGLGSAVRAALAVELVDVTLGWAISWWIGPGAPDADQRSIGALTLAVLFVFFIAVTCALLGATVARFVYGRRSPKNA